MKEKFLDYYMSVAEITANLSYARKLKVGAILVKDDSIIGFSYNGTPIGHDNTCEDVVETAHSQVSPEWVPVGKEYRLYKTRPIVSHAEENLIVKVAKSNNSTVGATMFCTHACCPVCARMIYNSGIKEYYYRNDYRDDSGVKFLEDSGIKVVKC